MYINPSLLIVEAGINGLTNYFDFIIFLGMDNNVYKK